MNGSEGYKQVAIAENLKPIGIISGASEEFPDYSSLCLSANKNSVTAKWEVRSDSLE